MKNAASSPRPLNSRSPRKIRKVVPVDSPRTRQRARATKHFPRLPVLVPGTEPPSHDLHGVLHPQKKIKVMAEQWAQQDEAVKTRLGNDFEFNLTKTEERLSFFCS